MMLVKICGITNKDDALHAVAHGASHIGVIFAPKSPRCLSAETAGEISAALGDEAQLVGVFLNQDVEEVARIAKAANLAMVQLHGEESADYCTNLSELSFLPLIKVININPGDDIAAILAQYKTLFDERVIDYILFDKPKGLTESGDWLLQAVAAIEAVKDKMSLPPFFFAGGLHADNLHMVPHTLGMAGFDVASGVEKSAGIKDPALVQKFIENALK